MGCSAAYRTAFYRRMKLLFFAAAGLNCLLAAGKASAVNVRFSVGMLCIGLIMLLISAIQALERRRDNHTFPIMVGSALSHGLLFGLAMWGVRSWLLAVLFVMESVLLWAYFVVNRPRPL